MKKDVYMQVSIYVYEVSYINTFGAQPGSCIIFPPPYLYRYQSQKYFYV